MSKSGSQSSNEMQTFVVSLWSCFNCRRRKSRCNRQSPCGFCSKAGVECLYPLAGRMPTRQHGSTTAAVPSSRAPLPRKQSETQVQDLLDRLRQLENVVNSLKAQAQDKNLTHLHTGLSNASLCKSGESSIAEEEGACVDMHATNSHHDLSHKLSKSFGSLQVYESGAIYTGNAFWAALHGELRSVRQAFEASDIFDLSTFQNTPPIDEAKTCHMPFNSDHSNLLEFVSHPAPNLLPFIWKTYIKNVDPFIKVLHVPTMSEVVRLSESGLENMSSGTQALLFSVSLAAVVSLSDTDVQKVFGDTKENVLSRFVLGTEKALSKASILKTTDICVAQAFLIYLESAGHRYGMRTVWMMSGNLVRAAISMGLHRDGATFPNVSYFEAEMRRRLWWHIFCFDGRVSQCYAPETIISNSMFDTKEPTNCNDDDLEVGMVKEPTAREGFTDVSFTLMSCELRRLCNHILSSRSSLLSPGGKQQMVKRGVLRKIEDTRKWANKTFFRRAGTKLDVQSFTEFFFGMLLDQLGIIVRDTNIFEKCPPTEKEPHIRDQSYKPALTHIENMRKLRDDPSMRQWGWVLVNFQQWYAVGIVLIHLQAQTWDSACERAWTIAVETLNEIPPAMMTQNPLRESITSMITAARQHRAEELARQRCEPESHDMISLMPEIDASMPVSEDLWSRSSVFNFTSHLSADIVTAESKISDPLNGVLIDTNYPLWHLEPINYFDDVEPSCGSLQDLLFYNGFDDRGNLELR